MKRSSAIVASTTLAFFVGMHISCTEHGAGDKASQVQETADGDFENRDTEVNFAWTVVDPDPAGLNCRGGTPFGEGRDISKFRVSVAFPKNSIIFGLPSITRDSDGKAWLFVAFDASGCFVRANSRFILPLDLPMEYPVGFREILAPKDPSLPPPLISWFFTTKEPTPCRQQPSSSAAIVRSFKRPDQLGDLETEKFFNPGLNQAKIDNPDRDEQFTILVTDAIEIDGESWFKLWMARRGPIEDPKNVCFIRASRQILRPVR